MVTLLLYVGGGAGQLLPLPGHDLLQVEEEQVGQLSEPCLLIQQPAWEKGHIA